MVLETRRKHRRCACAAAAAAAPGWTSLPDDLLDCIAAFLTPDGFQALALVCKAWSAIVCRPREVRFASRRVCTATQQAQLAYRTDTLLRLLLGSGARGMRVLSIHQPSPASRQLVAAAGQLSSLAVLRLEQQHVRLDRLAGLGHLRELALLACDIQPGRGAGGACRGGALPLLSAGHTTLRTLSLAGSELHLLSSSFVLDAPCLASLDLSNALAVCSARGKRAPAHLVWAGGAAPASLASLQVAASHKRAAAFAPVPKAVLAGPTYAALASLVASSPMLPHDCRALRGLTRLDVCEPWFCGFDASAMFPSSLRSLCMRTWPNEEGAEVLDALARAADGGMRLEHLEWSGIGCRTNFYMHFEPEALGAQQSLRSLTITVPVCPGCLFWSLRQLTALEALEFRQPTVCYEEEMASASRSLWMLSLKVLVLRIYFTALDLRACRSLCILELGKSVASPLSAESCAAVVRVPAAGAWTQLKPDVVKWERSSVTTLSTCAPQSPAANGPCMQ